MNSILEEQKHAGVLLHISSLPGEYGLGTFGASAYAFVDFCRRAGFQYWQVLPLVQTGYGDSPYQSVCAHSGNPYFIDPETLAKDGLLTADELAAAKLPHAVDYGRLYQARYALLRRAYARFDRKDAAFTAFCESGKFRAYALYMTVKGQNGNQGFIAWQDRALRYGERDALARVERECAEEYCFWQFVQFEFRKQWQALKAYANRNGVKIVGDLPLYVAYDSSDVWEHPELFALDESLQQTEVAGCPPDYFSKTGQLWGNPIYRWEAHEADGYRWWLERIRDAFETYDVVRIDHFRGFDRYYAIPAGSETAQFGAWQDGPKIGLFTAAEEKLGRLELIAEDLGVLDDGVLRLLKEAGYPGMRILLFAFDGSEDNRYLPKNIDFNSVCYTGTHDNDTVMGYYKSLSARERKVFARRVAEALRSQGIAPKTGSAQALRRGLLEMALASNSRLAVLPMQDILGLDNAARMNLPGTNEGNWRFRLKRLPADETARELKKLLLKYGRV